MREPMESEATLVAAAGAGDEGAFRQMVDPVRHDLQLLCYRMLGSFHDAEEVLQDALMKAWNGLRSYDERATFRTWIYRVTTNACLDALRARRRRVLPQDVDGARDPAKGLGEQRHDIPWLEPYPDSQLPGHADPAAIMELRESVRLAFVRALQILPPRQRAVLILRDVLGWTASDVAATLDTSVAAANSLLQRARTTTAQHRPMEADGPPQSIGETQYAAMAARYVRAWEEGDMEAIVAMLTTDATHAMPPWPAWFVGREALGVVYRGYEVWGATPGPGVFRILPTSLNGELAFAEYCRTQSRGPYHALALTVATLDPSGTQIRDKVSFVSADLMVKMGFPSTLA